MGQLISMPQRDSDHRPVYIETPRWDIDRTSFLGFLATSVSFVIIFGAHFGLLAFVMLVASFAIGSAIGLNKYRHSPAPVPSCIPPIVMRTSARRDLSLKLAA